ncbi:MAG: hypothetical protein ACK4NQ_03040 [Fimbriimonadaceae bacterium]
MEHRDVTIDFRMALMHDLNHKAKRVRHKELELQLLPNENWLSRYIDYAILHEFSTNPNGPSKARHFRQGLKLSLAWATQGKASLNDLTEPLDRTAALVILDCLADLDDRGGCGKWRSAIELILADFLDADLIDARIKSLIHGTFAGAVLQALEVNRIQHADASNEVVV